jgi:hypothetical protein
MKLVIAIAVAGAGCVTVAPDHRCTADEQCVLGGVQGRCEDSGACSFPDASCGSGGFRYHEHAGDHAGICVVTANTGVELPAIELDGVTGAPRASCALQSAHEAYVELVSPGPQTIYVDTGGSATDVAATLAVFEGSCPPTGNQVTCGVGACGPGVLFGRAIVDVLPGSYCLAVSAEAGSVALRVLPAGRFALQVPTGVATQETTCNQGDGATASCAAQPGPEAPVIVPMCPGSATLGVTVDPDDGEGLDAVLSLRQVSPVGADVMCSNVSTGAGPEMIETTIGGPAPYYAVIDRAGGASCGHFAIAITVTPQ